MADKVDKSLTQGPRGSAIIPGEEQIKEAIVEEEVDRGTGTRAHRTN
jgi:hypothetical protein